MRTLNVREISIYELQEDIENIIEHYADNPGCTDIYYIIDDGEVKSVLYPYDFKPQAKDVERFVVEIGNNYEIELPIVLIKRLGWEEGDTLDMEVKDGAIVVKKVKE